MWSSEDNLQNPLLFFIHVGPRARTLIVCLFVIIFQDRVSLHTFGCSGTHSGLELRDLPSRIKDMCYHHPTGTQIFKLSGKHLYLFSHLRTGWRGMPEVSSRRDFQTWH